MAGSLPPGPDRLPLWQTVEYVRRPLALLEECERDYGQPFTLRLFQPPPFIVFSSPAAVREIFRGDPEILRSGEANRIFEAGLGRRSILVLDGPEHLRDRRLLLPAFHGERVSRYGSLIAGLAEREFASWPSGRELTVAPRLRRLAMEVIVAAVFGVRDRERALRFTRALSRFMDATAGSARVFSAIVIKPGGLTVRAWNRWSVVKRRMDRLIYDEIARRRVDPGLEERDDVLSLLLQARDESGKPLADEHLRDELVTLLVAGHETTANSTAWAFVELSRRPDAWEPLAAGDDEWTDAVVKETLRLRPIVPFVVRKLAAPLTIDGHDLPAGVRVAPSVHLVHRRPDVYPNPEAFRPERFVEGSPDGFSWIPFGGGTRRCLGAALATLEMKTILQAAARAGRPAPARREERVGRRGLTLAPGRGGCLVWEPMQARAQATRPREAVPTR